MTTDTSEKGLELLIVRSLTGLTNEQIQQTTLPSVSEVTGGYGGSGYLLERLEKVFSFTIVRVKSLPWNAKLTLPT